LKRDKLVLGLALALMLLSCATPLQKAAMARGTVLQAGNLTQPVFEGETVLGIYRDSYEEDNTVCGEKLWLSLNTYTRHHPSPYSFSPRSAAPILLGKYVDEFPSTSIEDVKKLDIRSIKHLDTYFSGSTFSTDCFTATTTYYFQGTVVRVADNEVTQ